MVITGLLLVFLVVNDFVELLIEDQLGISNARLPIEYSSGGWKLKFAMMDNPPAFAIYQVVLFMMGFVLMFVPVFKYIPKRLAFGLTAGLGLSAIFVLVAKEIDSMPLLIRETPTEFMIAQLLAALVLAPALISGAQWAKVRKSAIITAALILLVLVVAAILRTPITLTYLAIPFAGALYLLITDYLTPKSNTSISS